MVDNRNNGARRRSLRDAPPLTSGSRNMRRISATDRKRDRARSTSPIRRRARSRDRERETRRDLGKRYQHMKGSARTQTAAKNAKSPAARPNNFTVFNLHEDQAVIHDTLHNAAHTARYLKNRTADSPDPFVASENVSSYLQPPQNMSESPTLVNGILLESLRMADYLQRNTAADARPYCASPEVARYLEYLRENYPEALVYGRMEEQDQSVADLGGVGVGESVMSPVVDMGDSHYAVREREEDPNWYNDAWNGDWDDAAKGDV